MANNAASGIVCLTGVSPQRRDRHRRPRRPQPRHRARERRRVRHVNANLRHYALAAEALGRADRVWLERLITRRVPLEDFEQAFEKQPDDVKVVLEL